MHAMVLGPGVLVEVRSTTRSSGLYSLQVEGGSAMCSGLFGFCIYWGQYLSKPVDTFRTDSVEGGGTRALFDEPARTESMKRETCLVALILTGRASRYCQHLSILELYW